MELKEYKYGELSCSSFIDVLGSAAPVPGGGGASALAAAVGTALGNMVGCLTVGKKKYAAVEEEMRQMIIRCKSLQEELLELMDKDAKVFAPLAKAYSLPGKTPEELAERERIMEPALRSACEVPLEIMEKCCEAIVMLETFAEKGSVLAVSDAGAGAAVCAGALRAASLNVYINTRSMKDRSCADAFNARADRMLEQYLPAADAVFHSVRTRIYPQM